MKEKKEDQINQQIWDQKRNPIWNQIWDQIFSQIWDQILIEVTTYFEGSLDSYIFATFDYCLEVLQLKLDEVLLKKYVVWKATHILGPIYCLEDVAVVSKLPSEIHVNEEGELHCSTGPALSYEGSLELFYLDGVDLVEEPDLLRVVVSSVEDRLRRIDDPIYGETFRGTLL